MHSKAERNVLAAACFQFNFMLRGKSLAQTPAIFTQAVREHENVSGGERSQHAVVSYSGQPHSGNATTLAAVWISSELAGRNARGKIG